jgi:iron complex transport system substrate-binding protein
MATPNMFVLGNQSCARAVIGSAGKSTGLASGRALVFVVFSTLIALAGGCRKQSNSSIKGMEKGSWDAVAPAAVVHRVVTLTPSLTEIVFALGSGERVVGVSDYCDYPEAARTRPRVGTFLQPSVEKILALRPDLVLLDGVQRDVAAALQAAGGGVRVLAVAMDDLAQVREAITQVGAALGDPQARAAATALLGKLDGELAEVRRIVARRGNRPPRKVLFVVDRQPGGLRGLVVAGPGSYLDELLRLAGGSNVFSDLKVRYAKIAVESVEERLPEVIFDAVHTEQGSEGAARADWQALPGVPAVKSGHIYILGDREFVTPGPRLGEALRRLAEMIDKD